MTSRDPSNLYDAYYFAHNCGEPYQRSDAWLNFFEGIAERIVQDIQPANVLDAGCAMGFLVESLRKRGVDAWGVDVSEYAIERVHPDVQPYCWLGSVIEPLPRRYDLIVCIEVLEHLPARQAEQAIENLCAHSDDILFSSTPFDYKEATHYNVQPPEYWAALFARHGFLHDLDFDATFITPWALRFRKARAPLARVVTQYERRLWQLSQENRARRELGIEQRDELAGKERELAKLNQQLNATLQQLQALRVELADIRNSNSWQLLQRLQAMRLRLIPQGSPRERWLYLALRGLRYWRHAGTLGLIRRLAQESGRRAQILSLRLRARSRLAAGSLDLLSLPQPAPLQPHQAEVDIVICVHNALEDVRRNLEALLRYTLPPYNLILVDDGSDPPTRDYLAQFAAEQGVTLLRNDQARGYTRAANQGLRQSTAPYVVLLNSDTIVTPEWLDRMVACIESHPRIGMVGPLSNTASWQSIPAIFDDDGDWAANELPEGYSVPEMGRLIARHAARLYPRVAFLNGFCLMVRREALDEVGLFDEDTFGEGYGEENDYCLRLRKAGWELAVADDTFIYHAQSRSYSNERRLQLVQRADQALREKHGQEIISTGVELTRASRPLQGIRARSRVLPERQRLIREGMARWEGQRVAFLLPLTEAAGGGHVIVQEAQAMQQMGLDVRLINLRAHKGVFEANFPAIGLPVIYVEKPQLPARVVDHFDAVVASVYHSVAWLDAILPASRRPVKGYYIQDFEPHFFDPASAEHQQAHESYTRFSDLVRVTKTAWNRQQVWDQIGVDCTVIGPSVDIDLFRPRPRQGPDWPARPLRVAAMVRPSTPRRQAELTMQVLKDLTGRHKGAVEVILFGCHPDDPDFHRLPTDFPWRHAGLIPRTHLAALLNAVDIFADFSSYQAMGLTAMEAMACGVAVIVPQAGGAHSFAVPEENALFVDTGSRQACLEALERLVTDEQLRNRLGQQALDDVCRFFPEQAAFNLLEALFGAQG